MVGAMASKKDARLTLSVIFLQYPILSLGGGCWTWCTAEGVFCHVPNDGTKIDPEWYS